MRLKTRSGAAYKVAAEPVQDLGLPSVVREAALRRGLCDVAPPPSEHGARSTRHSSGLRSGLPGLKIAGRRTARNFSLKLPRPARSLCSKSARSREMVLLIRSRNAANHKKAAPIPGFIPPQLTQLVRQAP